MSMMTDAWMAYTTLAQDTVQHHWPQVERLLGNEPLHAWLENPRHPAGFKLDDNVRAATAAELLQAWEQGRIFGEQSDLRWEHQPDGTIYLVIMSTVPPVEGQGVFAQDTVISLEACGEPYAIMLWGIRRARSQGTAIWEEGRIPALDRWYPAHWAGPYAAIRVQSYESVWRYAPDALPTRRTITRYIRFEGQVAPPPVGDMDDDM